MADADKASVLCLGRRASVVLGGRGGDRLVGGRQLLEVFRGGPGNDFVNARQDHKADIVVGGPGMDTCWVDPEDSYRGCESFG